MAGGQGGNNFPSPAAPPITIYVITVDVLFAISNPTSAKLSLKVGENCQLPAIPDVGITRCGHIERKKLDTV